MAERVSGSRRLSPPRLQFSIRAMLIVTTAIAAAFPICWLVWTLLLNASVESAAAFAFWLTASILAVSSLVAWNREGAIRSYGTGFSVVGLMYFLLVPCNIAGNDVVYSRSIRDQLITTQLSREFHRIQIEPQGVVGGIRRPLGGPNQPNEEDFVQVAQLLWTIAFAFLGGWVSLLIYWTGRQPGD